MANPLKIVILGANGQIGSEAALYLSMQPDVQVIGMVRAEMALYFCSSRESPGVCSIAGRCPRRLRKR